MRGRVFLEYKLCTFLNLGADYTHVHFVINSLCCICTQNLFFLYICFISCLLTQYLMLYNNHRDLSGDGIQVG